jgi:thymidylate synthase (FAD)
MNIVTPYARILDIHTRAAGIELLKKIEWCGRISHRSEDAQTPESWERFIKAVVIDHGDWSIVEHATATVDMVVDRGVTHELVRHRLFSFTQESTRFVNYEK